MRPLRLRLLSVQFQLSFQRVPSSLRYAKFRLPSVFTIVQEAIQPPSLVRRGRLRIVSNLGSKSSSSSQRGSNSCGTSIATLGEKYPLPFRHMLMRSSVAQSLDRARIAYYPAILVTKMKRPLRQLAPTEGVQGSGVQDPKIENSRISATSPGTPMRPSRSGRSSVHPRRAPARAIVIEAREA